MSSSPKKSLAARLSVGHGFQANRIEAGQCVSVHCERDVCIAVDRA